MVKDKDLIPNENGEDSEQFKHMNSKLNKILSKINSYKCKIHLDDTLGMNHIREQHLQLECDGKRRG